MKRSLWMAFTPNNKSEGLIHPRFALWYAESLLEVYDMTKEKKYLGGALRVARVFAEFQQKDGTIYYTNYLDGRSNQNSLCGSATAFAGILWLRLRQYGAGAEFSIPSMASKILIVLLGLVCFAVSGAGAQISSSSVWDVRNFGAVGDGSALDTRAIQAAIDTCSVGGGTVLLSAGKFLSGTIFLRSNVTLEIAGGATLLGSTNIKDYPLVPSPVPMNTDIYHSQSLIVGIDLENIALAGRGTIDGQGKAFSPRPKKKPERYKDRPIGIRMLRCKNVRVEGLTLRNSAKWMQHYFACERVLIRGITVDNNSNMNNDMLDIDGCRDVTVSDCVGESDDDALTLKSTTLHVCENVTITNCVIGSHCNALKMGTESVGGFRNIAISNIVIRPTRHDSVIFGARNGQGGITLTIVDGGTMDGVVIDNVRIEGPRTPIFLRLGDRGRLPVEGAAPPGPGRLRNVTLSNIVASGADTTGCSITGLPGHPVEGVVLSNIRLTFRGGGAQVGRAYPELPGEYPEGIMFGPLPGYGINMRHVRDVTLRDIDMRVEQREARCAVDADDAVGLDLDGVKADAPAASEAFIRLNNCANTLVRGCVPRGVTAALLAVRGAECSNIRILQNDLTSVRRLFTAAKEVKKDAIGSLGSR